MPTGRTPATLPPRRDGPPDPSEVATCRVISGEAGACPDAGAAAVNPAIAAVLPRDLLQPGEIVILMLKPSLWYVLLMPLKTYAALALLTVAAALLNRLLAYPVQPGQVAAAGAGLLALRSLWQFLDWLSRTYLLTDQRIVTVAGVLRVVIIELPLNRIQHTQLLATLRERLVGLGTLGFATSGTDQIETLWLMLERPADVHRKVLEALRRYRR